MSGLEVLAVVGVAVAVVTAALLAAAETSFTQIGMSRAEALEGEDHRNATLLRQLVERRVQVLSPVLLVILACHLGAATIVAVLVERAWGTGAVAIALAVEVLVLYVVAEAIPKTYALSDPDRAALRFAPLLRLLSRVAPLRWLTSGLASLGETMRPRRGEADSEVMEEELLAVTQRAVAEEAIDPEEQKLIASILEFGDTVAREVMVPRPDMITVSQDFRIGDVLEVVILNGLSRLPATAESIDEIVGVVYAKDLMRAQHDGLEEHPVSEIMRDPIFVPETKRIATLMREMQAETFHLAIVVDEYGGTAGLLTLEDLIEELVGEIVDEFDVEQPMIERLPGRELRVNGRVSISDLAEELAAELPDGDWDTVGGLIFNSLGHVPEVGERLDIDGFRLTVERVNGRRISRVRVSPTATSPAG